MHGIDWTLLGLYLAGVLGVGLAVRRSPGRADYLLAGRSMGALPIGLSVMVTAFSAINFVAFPSEVFANGLYVAVALPIFPLVAIPVTRGLMPYFHRLELTSAYAFLEGRFDGRVRRLASGLFLLWRVLWMGTALFASARILAALTGLPLVPLLLVAGLVATVYTGLGGMRAVLWTDCAQFVVLFGGIAACVLLAALRAEGGAAGILAHAAEAGRLQPFWPGDAGFLVPDPRTRITLWSGAAGVFAAFLARYAADQVVVQRYFTARSLRAMRRGFWWNVLAAVTAIGLLGLLGLAAHAHAALAGPPGDAAPPLAHLVRLVRSLPAGLTGVVAAGLLAATMSSIDSGIHACSTAWLEDWRPWLAGAGRGAVREESAALRRGLTAGFGVLATGMALGFIPLFGRHAALFPMVNKVLNGMGSPLLALILAALLSRRANAPGAFWGGLAGALLSAWTSFGVGGLALHLYAVINLAATWALIALASAAWRAAGAETTEAQRAWTWRAVMARGAPGGAPGADGTGDAGGD